MLIPPIFIQFGVRFIKNSVSFFVFLLLGLREGDMKEKMFSFIRCIEI